MDVISVIFLLLLIICVYLYYAAKSKTANMPPGPMGLPLLGHIPLLYPRAFLVYTKYKKYGSLCTIRWGPSNVVLLNSYQAIHEAFLGQAETFSGRWRSEYLDMTCRNSGIAMIDGPVWQENRRYSLRLMREFGSGRDTGETIVREECLHLKERLLELSDQEVNTQIIFMQSINNVIAQLVFGERCGTDDPKFAQFAKDLNDVLVCSFLDVLPAVLPVIAKVPPLLALFEYLSGYRRKLEDAHDYVRDKINQRRDALRSMDPPPTEISQASNICEAFLIEQAKQEAANPGRHTFTEWQLIRNMFEVFIGGTETTSTTLKWTTLLLAIHPEIQTRVQQEIEEHIGRDRSPTMGDKQQLPYVSAVMDEVLRYSSLLPNTIEHTTMQDTHLMGFFIPARTLICANLYGVHHDPELWAKPDEFYPEHFLSPEGDYRPSKYLIPFSIGKRACLGESLARMEFFLALVTLMQTFRVRLADPKADLDSILLGTDGFVRHPGDHKIIFSTL